MTMAVDRAAAATARYRTAFEAEFHGQARTVCVCDSIRVCKWRSGMIFVPVSPNVKLSQCILCMEVSVRSHVIIGAVSV